MKIITILINTIIILDKKINKIKTNCKFFRLKHCINIEVELYKSLNIHFNRFSKIYIFQKPLSNTYF